MTPISYHNIYQTLSKPNLLLNSIHIILLLYKKILSNPLYLGCVSPPQKAHSLMLVPGFYLRQPFPALNGPFPSQPLLLRTPNTPSPLTKFPSTLITILITPLQLQQNIIIYLLHQYINHYSTYIPHNYCVCLLYTSRCV